MKIFSVLDFFAFQIEINKKSRKLLSQMQFYRKKWNVINFTAEGEEYKKILQNEYTFLHLNKIIIISGEFSQVW